MNEIALYIVTWTEDGKPRVEVFTDPIEAGLERDCQFFNKGHTDAALTEVGLGLADLFPKGVIHTLLHRSGEHAQGLFMIEEDAHAYASKNYPLEGRKKRREFEHLEIDISEYDYTA